MGKYKLLWLRHKLAITSLLTISLIFSPIISSGQQTVGLFTKKTGEQDGYVLFSPQSSYITYLIDKCGKLIHKWNTGDYPGLDAYLLPNGDLLSTGRVSNSYFSNSGSAGGLVQIFSWNGKLKWSYTFSDSTIIQDHDVWPMPNGNILICEWERFTSSQTIANGRNSKKQGNSDTWSIKIQEIKPVGGQSIQVVWQWRLWDHLIQDVDSSRPNFGVVADHPELLNINYFDTAVTTFGSADWTHGNAVTYNPDLDQVMISSRNLNEIYILDHSTTTAEAASHSGGKHGKGGDFLYRWGNPAAYNRGTEKDKRLFVQHNPLWIPDGFPGAGNISVFNNGDGRPKGPYSSADIFKPPVDSNGDYKLDSGKAYGPDSCIWSYVAPNPKDFYSSVQGGVLCLANGNVLICETEKGNFFEVDSGKNILWRYVDPDGGYGPDDQGLGPGNNQCYRADLYMANYPAFKNISLIPGAPVELNPYAYSCYMPFVLYTTPMYKIAELKGYDSISGIADSLNKGKGYIKAVVESQNMAQNGNVQFAVTDSTGSITITSSTTDYIPKIGDSVLVGGIVKQPAGLTEYAADTIIPESKGTWQKTPDIVTNLGEKWESDLITIKNVWLPDTSQWIPKGNGFLVEITNGHQSYNMYINRNTDLFKMKVPNEVFNVTGIEIQNDATEPFFSGYEIEPRGIFDIERVIQLYNIREIRIQDQNTGIADSSKSGNNFYIKGIVQSTDFSKKGLNFSVRDITGSIIISSPLFVSGYSPTMGDSVEIRGVLRQLNGLTFIVPDSILILKSAHTDLKAIPIHYLSEYYEAQLIKLSGYWLTNPSQWISSGDGFMVDITNGKDTVMMRIGSGTNLFNNSSIQGIFNVTGIEIQNQPDSPYFGNYIIEPRGKSDIQKYIPYYNISQVRIQNSVTGIADSAGSIHPFFLTGLVQSSDYSSSGLNFSMKDSTGAIMVYSASQVSNFHPEIGDSIILKGLLTQYDGLTEVIPDSIFLINKKSLNITPEPVKGLSENEEAHLIKLNGYHLAKPSQWVKNGGDFNVDITNGKDTIIMNISGNIDLSKINAPEEEFNIAGIEIQVQQTPPYFGNYQIKPRGIFDIQRVTPLYTISQIRDQDNITGIADSVGSPYNFYIKAVVQSQDLISSGLEFSVKDSTGSIMISNINTISNYVPIIGDSLLIRGLLIQTNGLTEILPDSILKLNTIYQVIKPVPVSSLSEQFESQLIKLNGYYITDTMKWLPAGKGFKVNITNGRDTFSMYISAATDLFNRTAIKGVFNVSGIEIQNKTSLPYFGNYQIVPRGFFDFERTIQLYNIRQVRVQNPVNGIADSAGSKYSFLIKGIVQSPDFLINGYEFSIKDSTGSVFVSAASAINNYYPAPGDSVEIRGLLRQHNGLTSVSIDSIGKLKSGSHQIKPIDISILNEANEAVLVRFNKAWLVNSSQWGPNGLGFYADVTNGLDSISLYISSATNTYNSHVLKGKFNITGICSQDKSSSPYFGGYYLMPRNLSDFQIIPEQLHKIREIKGYNPTTGIADSINTYCYLKGIVQSGNLSGENSEFYSLQDSTGSITITSNNRVNGYNPVIGDSIIVSGMVLQENGLTIFRADSVMKLAHTNQISPLVIKSLDEQSESELVTLKNYSLADPSKWDTTGANGSFLLKAYNESDTVNIKIVNGTDLYSSTAKPKWKVFDVSGIESQNDLTIPYLYDYYLIPRSISDFEHSSSLSELNDNNKQIELFPNPAIGNIMIKSNMLISKILINDILGKLVYSNLYVNSNNQNIEIGFLNKGVYVVKIYEGFDCEAIKLIKE